MYDGPSPRLEEPMDAAAPAPRRTPLAWALGALLALAAGPAGAFPGTLNDWQERYGAISPSGDNAQCQLCHGDASGGSPWNAYGWDVLLSLEDAACDRNGDGVVSNGEAFFCVETLDSDGDPGATDNATEIGLGVQPGWTLGAFNTLFERAGTTPNQPPPSDIGPVDPDGTEPPPPEPPPPPDDEEPVGPLRFLQLVRPGQSLQRAIDRARPGGIVLVLPGVYREIADPTNGLNISKGVRLIGLSSRRKRVVLENAGNQRNGIAVVPSDRTDCMSCHSGMAPPFPLHPWVDPDMKSGEPTIHGFSIRGFTIRGFANNGLFTENVDGFSIVDVESVDNRNYGIFPTLSRNGIITRSRATGADDSGIWVETSENVRVSRNLVEGNVNGFEVSNSDDIVLERNVARHNTVGMAILLLPDIFDDRPGAKRITIRDNWIYENNRENTARPGSILSTVPAGIGILHLGVDESEIRDNWVLGHDFVGIALVDYCAAVLGSPFACGVDPSITPEFLADQSARDNRVVDNIALGNGTNVAPGNPFAFAASDLGLLTDFDGNGNCFAGNVFDTFFALAPTLPECPAEDLRGSPGRGWGRGRHR